MDAVKIQVELPSDLIVALNVEPSDLGRRAREWILMELFLEGIISAGKAAEILGTTKHGFLQLLDLHGLPYLHADRDDLQRQLHVAVEASRTREVS